MRDRLQEYDPEIFDAILGEERRQQAELELIPSENYTYPEVLAALGTVFTNKYSEGYPGNRYYGGQTYTDAIERLATARARDLFGAEHANVQALSGAAMNQVVYYGLLEPGDSILAMDLSHGGHLTHGSPVSHMARVFDFHRYKADAKGRIDFDEVQRIAEEVRPKMVLCGHSSYPRDMDYAGFKRVADSVGALTMADVSHIGGLIAGNAVPNPLEHGFDVVTTTTHKSLRGPRGGLVLCKAEFAKRIDKSVFPGLQGGPHMHTIAAIAVALKKAAEPEFREYAARTLSNAQTLAGRLIEHGVELVTGGTDNHLIVVNTIASFELQGREAQQLLERAGLATNKQLIPDDPLPAQRTSGVRLGTPAPTTRGMGDAEMVTVADAFVRALRAKDDEAADAVRAEVQQLCARFPAPGPLLPASA
ncbi:serine hydroxymethyltransferase [Amycolatopsis sp. SID8362]|uniref:serine hydroxymethyltransferase n=1 Tax=Amycolatopsis sp. SID8362 TaxID=2690346 RepID=UPI00136E5784|nr:serine hydroxymethyltransferase [Amycolatopsis sp. SID8362]NBH04619.1 serine hydroxymethyltransferase [Amycolatopsis sp. SID8362]NED41318.1 serine hydroxymethyltransferase [Amycolatopsis sp. SID8362]